MYEFTAKDLDGNEVSLEKYRDHPLIIVNVASNCGFTRRDYKALNELYAEFKDHGLRILGFPCDQFRQEPGDCVAIKEFIKKNNVEWDVFEKIKVNGAGAHPLFVFLKEKQPGILMSAIKWNFTKFVVNKEGIPIARYAPTTSAASLKNDIKKLVNLPEAATDAAPATTESETPAPAAPATVSTEAN